jgi:hypothetical protein
VTLWRHDPAPGPARRTAADVADPTSWAKIAADATKVNFKRRLEKQLSTAYL